jgi:DNA-binding PadR family transcriptional regulator
MTNAELAVLSLVVEQPRHGYEIEQVIHERGMRDWTEVGFSSIYFLLKKLEKAGLVESRNEAASGRGPARKVYRATPAGIKAHHQGVFEALSMPRYLYPPFQLGLANLPSLRRVDALNALQQYRKGLIERRDVIRQKWESQKPLPYFVDAMFDNSLALLQAELDWIEKFIQRVEAENDQA